MEIASEDHIDAAEGAQPAMKILPPPGQANRSRCSIWARSLASVRLTSSMMSQRHGPSSMPLPSCQPCQLASGGQSQKHYGWSCCLALEVCRVWKAANVKRDLMAKLTASLCATTLAKLPGCFQERNFSFANCQCTCTAAP